MSEPATALATKSLLRVVLGHPRRVLGSLDLESSEQYGISLTALYWLCLGKSPVQQSSSTPIAPRQSPSAMYLHWENFKSPPLLLAVTSPGDTTA